MTYNRKYFKKKDLFILESAQVLEQGERKRERGGEREREKEFQAGSTPTVWTPHRARFHDPKITTRAETRSWTPNQLSHPGVLKVL